MSRALLLGAPNELACLSATLPLGFVDVKVCAVSENCSGLKPTLR